MLNADHNMKNTSRSRKRSKSVGIVESESDAGFHFIAYVPVDEDVWKFDGLDRQPQKLGIYRRGTCR